MFLVEVFWGFVYGKEYMPRWDLWSDDLLPISAIVVGWVCWKRYWWYVLLCQPPNLLVLQCCCLLMWGVFLRETFWIVSIRLILCMLLAPELHPIFSIVLVCQIWGLGCHIKVCHWSTNGVQESEIKVI